MTIKYMRCCQCSKVVPFVYALLDAHKQYCIKAHNGEWQQWECIDWDKDVVKKIQAELSREMQSL